MLLKFKTLPRRGVILLPLSLGLALGFSAAAGAQPMSVGSSDVQAVTASAMAVTSAETSALERRVKSCAAPCRHKPSGMR